MSLKRLRAISECDDGIHFEVPPAYVKDKSLYNINSANRMHYHQKSQVKNKYKEIIEPVIKALPVFKTGHIHLLVQVYWADRRKRDLDNIVIGSVKYIQDSMVELGKLEDDKHVSFTMLPAIHDIKLKEHEIIVTCIDLHSGDYFKKTKEI